MKHWINKIAPKLHRAHPAAHAIYFAAVAVEAGKWYSVCAAILLVLTLAELVERRSSDGEGDGALEPEAD